jgi:hypothetical protein
MNVPKFLELGAVVASVDIGDDFARVVVCLEEAAGELVEATPLRTAELDDAASICDRQSS